MVIKKRWLKDDLIREYVENKKSSIILAKENNVSFASIIYWLKKYNIPRREAKFQKGYKVKHTEIFKKELSERMKLNNPMKNPLIAEKTAEKSRMRLRENRH